MPQTIFLSFASQNRYWVEQFTGEEYFLNILDGILTFNYTKPDNSLAFGMLDDSLKLQMEKCVAVFVFISKFYINKHATIVELEVALERFKKKNILLVPIILDGEAKIFWKELGRREEYEDVLTGYQYSDFSKGQRTRNIFTEGRADNDLIEKIIAIAETVMATLYLRAPAQEQRPITSESRSLVLLGDPDRAPPDPEIDRNLVQLREALSADGTPYYSWGHNWRRNPEVRSAVVSPASFLRVVTPDDLQDEFEAPTRTIRWLKGLDAAAEDARNEFILWNPGEGGGLLVDWPVESPVLRRDSVADLTKWASSRIKFGQRPERPFLVIINEPEFMTIDQVPYYDVVKKMIGSLVDFEPEPHSMNAERFKEELKIDRHRTLIVGIVDNNVSPIEQNGVGPIEAFENVVEAWRDEIAHINQEKGFFPRIFWVAVHSRLVELNPNSIWNQQTDQPVHVLRVFSKQGSEGKRIYTPDADSETRVAGYLRQWLSEPRP